MDFFQKFHARFNNGIKQQPVLLLVFEVVLAISIVLLFSLYGCSDYRSRLDQSQTYLSQADNEARVDE